MPNRELTITEIAELAGVSRQYVHAELKAGEFPNARQSGSTWLIPERDYKTWMKKRGQPVEG